jgi:hypothetical protein
MGIRILMMLSMDPKMSSPQKKELKCMQLCVTSQNKFYLEQYLKAFPSDTILCNNLYKVTAMCTMSVDGFFKGKWFFLLLTKV